MDPERSVFPLLFVIFGTVNVLLIKAANMMLAECSDGIWRNFQHPVVQTSLMFLGQVLCLLIYKIIHFFTRRRGDDTENFITRGGREFSTFSFLLPAFLDAIASVLLFTGLYLTYATSFQMIRVSGLIMSGIFGAIHLNQRLASRHWIAFFTITCGIISILSIDMQRVLYDSASLPPGADENSVLTGNLLVLCAQIFHGAKFVYEEKLLKTSDIPPMQACGWEGIFGLIISVTLGICMHFLPTSVPLDQNTHGVFDDLSDLFVQLRSNPQLIIALGFFMLSSAAYSFIALSIIKFSSAANHLLADGIRIMFIWLFALFLNWEYLNLISLLAFVILNMGAVAYRNAIFIEWYRAFLAHLARARYAAEANNENEPVVSRQPADVI